MLGRIARLISLPVPEDELAAWRARLLSTLLRATLVYMLVVIPITMALSPAEGRAFRAAVGLATVLALAGLFAIARRGRVWLASVLLCAFGVGVTTAAVYALGGLHSATMPGYLVIVAVAGLLLNGRWAMLFALLSMLAAAGALAGEAFGWIDPRRASTGLQAWVVYAAYFTLTGLLVHLAGQSIRAGLENSRRLRAVAAERAHELDALLATERKRARQLELLAGIAQRLTGLNDPQSLSDEVVRRIQQDFAFQPVAVYLVQDEVWTLVATAGLPLQLAQERSRLLNETGLVDLAPRQGASLALEHRSDEHHAPDRGAAMRSALAMSLRVGEQLLGMLHVESDRPQAFDATDVSTLESLAHLLAINLQSSRMFAEAQMRQRLALALTRLGQAITSTLDLPTVLDRVCTESCAVWGAEGAVVWLPDGDLLMAAAAHGPAAQAIMHEQVSLADQSHVAARAMHQRRPLLVHGLQNAPAGATFLAEQEEAQSELAVPILKHDQPVGVLTLLGLRQARRFGGADIAGAEVLGGQVAVAIENARLYEQAQARAKDMERLNTLTRSALEAAEIPQLLETLAHNLCGLMGADSCCLWLWDETGQRVSSLAAAGTHQGDYLALEAASGGASPLHTLRGEDRPATLVASPRAPSGEPPVARWLPSQAALALPLFASGAKIGAALVGFDQPRSFSPHDVGLGELAAQQIALAVDKSRALEAQRQRSTELEALRQASLRLTASLELQPALEQILLHALNLVRADDGHIFLYDGGRLTFGAALWAGGVQQQPHAEVRPQGLTYTVALRGERIVIPETRTHPLYQDTAWDGAIVGLPLTVGGVVRGVMNIAFDRARHFEAAELRILELLADQAAIALENARLFEAERQQRELAEALRAVGASLSGNLDSEVVLDKLLEQIGRVVPFDSGNVMLLEGGRVRLARARGYERYGAGVAEATATWEPHLTDLANLKWMAEHKQPYVIADVAADPEWVQLEVSGHIRSWAGAPILIQGQVIGFLSLDKTEPGFYQPVHGQRLAAFADQAALALQNSRLFEAEKRRARMLAALHDTVLDLTLEHDLPQLLSTIVERATHLLEADCGGLYLCDSARQEVRCVVSLNTPRDYAGTILKYGEGAAGHVARTGEALNIADYRTWPNRARVYESDAPFGPVLSVPMTWQGQVTGVIDVEHRGGSSRRFSEADLDVLSLLASQAAIAVENARLLAETRQRVQEQEVLYAATRDFTAGLAERAVLEAIARHMATALEGRDVAVSLWDVVGDRVITHFDFFVDGEAANAQGAYALADYPLTRQVLQSRTAVVVRADDPQADPAERALLRAFEADQVLLLPLSSADQVFGLVEVYRPVGAPTFDAAEVQMAHSLATQAGVALENARLHSTVKEQVRELDALLTANSALLTTLELEPLLGNVLAAAMGAIPAAEKGTILLMDSDTDQLQIRAMAGYTDPRVQNFAFAGSGGYSARAMREKRPLLIPDARADASIRYEGDIEEVRAIRSAIVAPLSLVGAHSHEGLPNDEPFGVISLDATRPAAFVQSDLRLLVAFANTAAMAIDHARLHTEVQTLAVTDSPTGLANHRAFERGLRHEVARAARYGHPLSLIFLDIDSFKQYNDAFGHPAGNQRLKDLAELLRTSVRDPDVPARYGGEEFAIYLPHTEKSGAVALAERIRAAAEAAAPARPAAGGPLAGYTLSLGVAAFPEDADTAEALLLAADRAELVAKHAGKNCVRVAPGRPEADGSAA